MRARVASWLAVIAVVGAGTAVTLAKPYEAAPPIRSDGLGYHAWTRAVVENDFRFCQWRALRDVGAISVENPRHPGRCQNKYAPGLALLRLPVMALVASQEGDNLVPSEAENWASLVLGLLSLVLTCVLISATLALLAVRPLVSNTVTLAACFGTGLFHYATFDSSFTHAHSAALFAGLVFLGVRAAQRDSAPHPVLLAALCFFIALVRLPDLLPLLAMVAAWVAWRYKQVERPTRPAGVRPALMSAGAGIAVALAVQVLYNRWASGQWAISSYGDETFNVWQLKERSVLLSYERGLFTYYPAMAVLLVTAVLGRPGRPWALTLAVAIGALTVLYGSWHSWFLGGGFGHRGFVELSPLAAVAGGIGVTALNRTARAAAIVALAGCVLITTQLMSQYWSGELPFQGTTKDQYWPAMLPDL